MNINIWFIHVWEVCIQIAMLDLIIDLMLFHYIVSDVSLITCGKKDTAVAWPYTMFCKHAWAEANMMWCKSLQQLQSNSGLRGKYRLPNEFQYFH